MGGFSEHTGLFATLITLSGQVLSQTTPEGIFCRAAEAACELTGAEFALCAPMDRDGRFREGGAVSLSHGRALYLERDRFEAVCCVELMSRLAGRKTVRWNEGDKGRLGAKLFHGFDLGVILLSRGPVGDFTAEEEETLGHFASLASCGLQHAWHLRRTRDELESRISRRTAALSKINRALKEEILERKRTQEQIRSYHEQLRFLASELSLSEERERRRIAVAVHDHVSQNLAAAKIKLETLRAAAPPDFSAVLKDIQDFIESSIQDARSIIMELSPPILYELGLIPALEWLAENMQAKYGIEIAFESSGHPPSGLDRNIQVLLFQTARELLWNVVKHARARHARLSFSGGEKIRIRVEDDGVGFDASGQKAYLASHSGGFGIFSIRERLRPLGGNVLMESAPGKGTRAVVEVFTRPSVSS